MFNAIGLLLGGKQIVLEGSTNDASLPGNNVTEKLENEPLSENSRGGQESNGDIVEQQSGGRKKEMVGRRVPFINSIHDEIIEEESLLPHRPDSREHSSSYPGRDVCTLQEERYEKCSSTEFCLFFCPTLLDLLNSWWCCLDGLFLLRIWKLGSN